MYSFIPQAWSGASYHQTWTMTEDPGHGKQDTPEIWSLIPHSEVLRVSTCSVQYQHFDILLFHVSVTSYCLPALLTVGIVPGPLELCCSREPIPALSQGDSLDKSPAHRRTPHWRAMWGSVSHLRTLRHAAQPCPELGFEPVTFQSLVDLLYPLSYSRPLTITVIFKKSKSCSWAPLKLFWLLSGAAVAQG